MKNIITQHTEYNNSKYKAGLDSEGFYFFQLKPNGVIKRSKSPFEIIEMMNQHDRGTT